MHRFVATIRVVISKGRGARALALALVAGASILMAQGSAVQAQERGKTSTRHSQISSGPPQSKVERVSTSFQFPVGSLVIVNSERRIYYISGTGEALRYRVAVGKNEELWMGRTFVASKVVDPRWIPVNGDEPVEGGDPANPLGKRALYLDWSLLRIHGTPSRGSIGSATSNGCIRMLNEDVIDLFERVHFGAPVYAIRSWKDSTLFEDAKVAEKIYHDPEGHREAQEALKEQLRERAGEVREREASVRRSRSIQRAATAVPVRVVNGFSGRYALGRSTF